MAKRVQIIGNTTANTATFVGRAREVTIDTDRWEVIVNTGGGAGTQKRIPNKDTNDTLYQTLSTLLTNIAALSSTDGVVAKTGAATVALRTLTGTSNQISISNGGGNGGNPTFSFPSAVTFPGSVVVTTTFAVTTTSTFTGVSAFQSRAHLNKGAVENWTIAATATSGSYNFDVLTQMLLRHTSNAAGNFSLNVRGDGSTSLNSIMTTGESITIVFEAVQGATPYYLTALNIDSSAQTINWINDAAVAAGIASGTDRYTFTILKTDSATFFVTGVRSSFG